MDEYKRGVRDEKERWVSAIGSYLSECMYLDDRISGEGCVGKWEGQKNCKGCDKFTIDTDGLKNAFETLKE